MTSLLLSMLLMAPPPSPPGIGVKVAGVTDRARVVEVLPGVNATVSKNCTNGACSVTVSFTGSGVPDVVNFSGSSTTIVFTTGTALPGTCTVGQGFFKTDAQAGKNIYLCTSPNTWTQVQGSGAVWGTITGVLSDQSDLQAALNGKASTNHSHVLGDIGQSGATTGQIPKWSGTAWVPAADDTGGSPSWGSITGTLSNQTDLQSALNGKASTTHSHSAADITSGVMAPARLGTGTPSTTTYLRGDGTWATVSTGEPNYSQSFVGVTSVAITHNAGTSNVVVSCYDSSDVEIIPQAVTITDTNTVTVTFSSATTGRCVVNSSGGGGGGGGGGVTSVGLSMPSGFTVTGSPVTSSGTLAVTTSLSGVVRASGGAFTVVSGNASDCVRVDGTSGACGGGGGTVYTGTGLTGDGSQTNPVRVDPTGGVASQAAYQATIDFAAVGAGSCSEQNITAVGVAAGSTLAMGWPATLPNGLVGMMYAGSDVIVVRLCNVTSASLDPPAATFTVRVIGGF